MSEVKVSKITIEIEGKGIIELTVEEAQKMKMCLDEIFKKLETIKEYIPISVPEINPAEGGIEVRGAYKPKPTEIGKRPAPTPSSPPKKGSCCPFYLYDQNATSPKLLKAAISPK